MVTSRQSRFVAALIAMFSMFFMQLAIAGYVCPDLASPIAPSGGEHAASVSVAAFDHSMAVDHSMASCHGMDIEQPNLCSAHAQVGDQSLDKHQLPQVQPFVAGFIANTILPAPPRDLFSATDSTSIELLERITAPPSSIQHCCFRI